MTSWRGFRRLALLVALLGILAVPFQGNAATGTVGPKKYYLALGDSLAFGYQPNYDFSHGYADQWFADLQFQGVQTLVNFGCPDETSTTFINGGCKYWWLQKSFHLGPQLNSALSFIRNHPGQVSPVSLDIGANEMLDNVDPATCTVNVDKWNLALATLDDNLTNTILPKLTRALKSGGIPTGDLILMNYYNPYQVLCPNSKQYAEQLNSHLQQDAARFGVRVADVYTAFNVVQTLPGPDLCKLTWICSTQADIHATGGRLGEPGNGYGAIMGAFELAAGY